MRYIGLVDKSFQGLILSLIIHGVLLWWLLNHPMPPFMAVETPTEITLVEKGEQRKPRYFVTETDKEETREKITDMANQLSALTKRVKKEIVARDNGPTQNRQKLQLNPRPTEPIPMRVAGKQGDGRQQQRERGEGPTLPPPGGGNALRQVAIGGSSISEHIPGVDEGAFTALNTDQLTYYAFFARINEQVRNRWVAMIRNYMGSLSEQDLAHLSRSDRQTVIEIVLTRTGEYVKGLIHSPSSVKPLDQAAVESFRAAAPFLNPPTGLVEADGFIHLRYVFMVRFRPYFGPGAN
jgi:hypothetical protein